MPRRCRGPENSLPSYHEYINPPAIVEIKPETTAAIHLTIARSRLLTEVAPARAEIMAALKSQGLKPSGPWFMHILSIRNDLFDFHVCVPTEERVLSTGRVEPHEIPSRRAVQTTYRGSYENFPSAWKELDAWTREAGRTPAGERIQRYIVGPESNLDPDHWETELTRFLDA